MFSRFYSSFKSNFGVQNCFKNCLKIVNFWVQFLIFFLGGFGAPWVSLGSLLGFLRLSWEASGPKNVKKHSVL